MRNDSKIDERNNNKSMNKPSKSGTTKNKKDTITSRTEFHESGREIDCHNGMTQKIFTFVIALIMIIAATNIAWVWVNNQDKNALNNAYKTIDDLEIDYDTERQSNAILMDNYSRLLLSFNDLKLNLTANDLYQFLRLDNAISEYYETIRNEILQGDIYGQDGVNFCAELSRHDKGESCWSEYENEYYDCYGTYSYEDARNRLDFILTYSGVIYNDTSVMKIDKILAFITQYINYNEDLINRYIAPIETLGYASGDCEDFSTLASALFELAGIESAIGFFENNLGYRHSMVLVQLDNLGPYEYNAYSNLTYLGLSSGKWIKLDPQNPIENQYVEIDQWDIIVASES